MVPFVPDLRQAVYTHLRVEPVLGRQMLIKHGMDTPRGFEPGRVGQVVLGKSKRVGVVPKVAAGERGMRENTLGIILLHLLLNTISVGRHHVWR